MPAVRETEPFWSRAILVYRNGEWKRWPRLVAPVESLVAVPIQ